MSNRGFGLFLTLVLALNGCAVRNDKKGAPAPTAGADAVSPGVPSVTPEVPATDTGTAIALAPTCPLPLSVKTFQLATPAAALSAENVSTAPGLDDIRSAVNSACKSCHLAPGSSTGGFSYQDQLTGSEIIVGNGKAFVPGFSESAEKMRDALLGGTMPPENIRSLNPEAYKQLGQKIDDWIKGGKLETSQKSAGLYSEAMWGRLANNTFTDLGNCLPEDKKGIGTDPVSDYYFEQASKLPDLLTDTDLISIDSTSLATKGTVAYDVEYPLWNDHTQKLRHIHQPAVIKEGKVFVPKPLEITQLTNISEPGFTIPENTRFYKTFFRGVKEKDGIVRYRPVETRVIVARNAPRKALFGVYVWREDGTNADLLKDPYRDGTAWKDKVLALDFNHQTGAKRNYMVPARHRCEQCHTGAPGDNFVLGFTPLQINRRDVGEAGRDLPVNEDELNQVKRFIQYGMLSEKTAANLPKLEYFPSSSLLDDHTVRAQGYMVGNCAHCHNPKGFAKLEGNISMNLSAGRIFEFDTNLTSSFFANKKLVNHEGKLDQSYLFHRVAGSDTELKLEARMPLHSTAGPDCRLVQLFSRWIKTYDPQLSLFDVNSFTVPNKCTDDKDYDSGDIAILEQDPTETTGPYAPRRADWNDPVTGMSEWFRSLRFDANFQTLSKKEFATDWWQPKAQCKFPEATLPAEQLKNWMVKPGTTEPNKPLGQLYWTNAGAYFYNLTCTKCHGRVGEADGPLAGNLDKWSGGSIRVANFRKGLFGLDGENIKQFEQTTGRGKVDLSGNYFIWMAYEGTKMNPPAQVADLLGTNKAQMLKTLIDRCARQIPSNPKATKPHFRDYDIFQEVCTYNNWPTTDPRLQYDLETGEPVDQASLDIWLKQAAANTGWSIYDYVRNTLAKGHQQFPQSECENQFPSR
ncbi:MAG: hypothetical protein V4655_01905 [Bdellovibrionota bacterium]